MKKNFIFVLTIAVLLICVACSQDQIEKMGKGFTRVGNINLGYGDRVAVGNVTSVVDEVFKDGNKDVSGHLDEIRSLIVEASQSDASAEAVQKALAKKVEGTDKTPGEATKIAAVVSDPNASVETISDAVDDFLDASGIDIGESIGASEDVVNVLKQAVPTLVALDKVLTERNTKAYESQGDIIATTLITNIVKDVVDLAKNPSASSEEIEELVKVVQTDVSVIETIYGVDFDLANLISIAGKLK